MSGEGQIIQTEQDVSFELVNRILAGDAIAENEMINRYRAGLKAMLFKRTRDRHTAEDIEQDTWVLAVQKIRADELKDKGKLKSFILSIGRNRAVMEYRGAKNQYHDSDDKLADVAVKDSAPEEDIDKKRMAEVVRKLLLELPKTRDREILRRFYLLDHDKQDICRSYELSPAHFDRVLYRARNRFKDIWVKTFGGSNEHV